MRKLLLITAGLCVFAALWKKESDEDDVGVALSPFVAALTIEAVMFILRRKQNSLMTGTDSV